MPLMLTAAPVQTGELVAPEAPPEVLEARGVEVPAGVEPEPAEPEAELLEPLEPLEAVVVEPAAEELELEPLELELELEELPVAEAEEALLVVLPAAVVVSTGGTEMGWPAEEH